MPLREPPVQPLTLSFATASASSGGDASDNTTAAPGSTILDQCLQLPKLHLSVCNSSSSSSNNVNATQAKTLARIAPLVPPFTNLPTWCLDTATCTKRRAIVLLDVYKDHERLTTHTVYHKSAYLIGRNAGICDIVLSHCSISRLHAAILHHSDGVSVYVIDLGSAHHTSVDCQRLVPFEPTRLRHGAQLQFGASSRSYTFKTFDSREQIADLVAQQVGLDDDARELNRNTLLNAAVSYRLELSPTLLQRTSSSNDNDDDSDEPMALAPAPVHERRSSTDDLTLSLAAFQHDEPARKRSRGQSGNSQGSSDHSMTGVSGSGSGDGVNQLLGSSGLDDDDDDAEEEEGHVRFPKSVHFSVLKPVEIPPPRQDDDQSPVASSPVDADSNRKTKDDDRTDASPWTEAFVQSKNTDGSATTRASGSGSASEKSLALRLSGLSALTIPTPPT